MLCPRRQTANSAARSRPPDNIQPWEAPLSHALKKKPWRCAKHPRAYSSAGLWEQFARTLHLRFPDATEQNQFPQIGSRFCRERDDKRQRGKRNRTVGLPGYTGRVTRKLGAHARPVALQKLSRSSEQPAPLAAGSVRALAPGLAPKVIGSGATTRAKAGDCHAMPAPDFHQRSFTWDSLGIRGV